MSRVVRCDRCPREDAVTPAALVLKAKPAFRDAAGYSSAGDLVLDLCPDCIDELREVAQRPGPNA